jgi:hypothetical protein
VQLPKQVTPSKRPASSCDHESQVGTPELGVVDGVGGMDSNMVLRDRPSCTKAAKKLHLEGKIQEGAMYAQAAATNRIATATMRKAALLEDHNMLLLMTTPASQVTTPEARRYLMLCQTEELKKLEKRLAADEEPDLQLQADQEQREREKLEKVQ